MSEEYLFTMLNFRTSRNVGMTVAWCGIIMAERYIMNTTSLPGKSSRAKAYPARALVTSWHRVTDIATMKLFRYMRAKGISDHTSR